MNMWIIKKIFKYAIWWWIAAIIDLSILYFLTNLVGIYYLISSIISFIVSLMVGFVFQKYITFQNFEKKHIQQWSKFVFFQLIGLLINTIILYIWVEVFHIYYLYIALFNKIIIFIWNFSMNYKFNFK